MRIFNELVFNGYVAGTGSVFSDARFHDLLGLADQLSLGGYTAQVTVGSGTPTLTVEIEQSFDKVRWQPRSENPEIDAVTLLTGANETIVRGHDGDPNPPVLSRLAFVRLRITLGVNNPAAQVRIWATGRDRSVT
jgi:hypothetical protein